MNKLTTDYTINGNSIYEPHLQIAETVESMLDENVNPFVIEGQLYDSENLVSYSIKYVDGKYIIKKYQLKSTDFNNVDIDILDFKAHRMGEGRVLQFLQYYREEEDSLCAGMKVLQPKEKVFVGFKK